MSAEIPRGKLLDYFTRKDELQIETNRLLRQLIEQLGGFTGPVGPVPPGGDTEATLKAILQHIQTGQKQVSQLVYGKAFYDSTHVDLTTSTAIGTKPTAWIELEPKDLYQNLVVRNFRLNSVMFYLVPTNAVTYQLMLYEQAVNGALAARAACVYASGAAKAASTYYADIDSAMLPVDVRLGDKGKLYFGVHWSAAPGDTTGFIVVRGELYSQDIEYLQGEATIL